MSELTEEMQQATTEVAETPEPQQPEKEAQAEPTEKMLSRAEVDELLKKERRTISKHTGRIRELESQINITQKQSRELADLRQDMNLMVKMVAQQLDAQGVSPTSTTYQQQIQELQQQRKPVEAETTQPLTAEQKAEVLRLEELVDDAGLDRDSEEMDKIHEIYRTEGYRATARQLKEMISSKNKPKETPEEMERRIEQKLMAKLGINSVETEVPTGAAGKRVYRITELEDPTFVDEHWEDIRKARMEGRIKE